MVYSGREEWEAGGLYHRAVSKLRRMLYLAVVRIGTGSVIGAGSVVTKDVPPRSIAVGNPARVVGQRISSA